MTFDPNVPNAGQSPGQFPPQNAANFTQLKKIITADHVFNDTAQLTDGFHKQVSMLVRAGPLVGSIAPADAILYSWLDASNLPQLRYYNGTTDVLITATPEQTPVRVVGVSVVPGTGAAPANTITAFANPGYTWCGTGWAMISGSPTFRFYNLIRVSINDIHELDNNQVGGDPAQPSFSFSGGDLKITNNDAFSTSLRWSLIINRLT